MQGAVDLLESERGIFCLVLVIACTALAVLGHLTSEQWIDYTKWIATTLVASKTVTGVVELMKKPSPSPTPAATPTPPTP